jgi:FixJ family two-component response regulator
LQSVPVISIVDDDESIREATQHLVRSLGFTVHAFASAEEFLQSKHLNDTCCVITDVQMPGLNGCDLQKRLIAQGCDLPIIFMTAFPDAKIQEQALRSGAIAFLSKPFDGEILIKHIETALVRRPPSLE